MRTPGSTFIGFQSKARFAHIILACLFAAAFLFAPLPDAFAQIADPRAERFGLDSGFTEVGVQTDRDVKSIAATIINVAFGFLGIVAVIVIMYAGYLWMTASGNEEQISRAKSILRNAVIGLVIILSSWAIAAFVISRLSGATGGGGDGDGGTGGVLPPGGGVAEFVVDSFETAHNSTDQSQDVQLCSSIQAQFNHWLNAEPFETLKNGDTLTIKRDAGGGTFVDEGTIQIEKRNNVISFKRVGGDGARLDWTQNTTYEVRLDRTLRDARGLELSGCSDCGGTRDDGDGEYHYWSFTTGTTKDSVAPVLAAAYPGNGDTNVPRSVLFSLEFSESIDVLSVITAAGELDAANIMLTAVDSGFLFPANVFDATLQGNRLIFSLNEGYVAVYDSLPYLEPYTEYRLTIQNIADLCGNELAPPVEITFTTGADAPGVSFVRPSNGYGYACPATPAFLKFNTSMYNVRTGSCGVDANGNAGLVLGGELAPAGIALRSVPEDNFAGSGNPNDFCKEYHFNLDPNDAADDLIPGTAYNASVSFIGPGDEVADAAPHAWSFTAAEASACAQEPYISYVSGLRRNQGQWEQCLTVAGRYFGDPKAAQSRAYTALSLDSPLNTLNGPIAPNVQTAWENHAGIAIAGQSWSDSSIAGDFISPPQEPIPVQPDVDFDIAVEVDHGGSIGKLPSNKVRFTVDTTHTFNGPCLYSISPTAGYWGDSVALTGRNLGGAVADQLTFYDLKTQAVPSIINDGGAWSAIRIAANVPNQAQNNPADGEVHVTVAGVQSNKLEFNLRAGAGQSCSAIANACSPDPGLCSPGLECAPSSCTCQVPDQFRIQNTQPSACTDSCTTAVISFEANMDIGDITGDRVQLKKCAGATQCSWDDPAAALVNTITALDGTQRVTIAPFPAGTMLDRDSWYLVRALGGSGGLLSADNKQIANLNADTGGTPGPDSYAWSFKTGSSACAVNRIELNQSRISLYEDESADLAARAYSIGNSCAPSGQEIIPPDNFTWRACEYQVGDIAVECNSACGAAELPGGDPILSVAASPSAQTSTTAQNGRADGSAKALVCARYDDGGVSVNDGAVATVYAACNTDADCQQGSACPGSVCLRADPNKGRCTPDITGFSPSSGVAGTWVTINGCYFGNSRGMVDIGVDPGGQPARAVAPDVSWCGATWSDTQVIAEVAPDAINQGQVRVERPGFDAVDSTGLPGGGVYTPNSDTHPGICRLSPAQGRPDDVAAIRGQGFGAVPGSVVFTVGAAAIPSADVVVRAVRSSCPADGWENNELCIRVAQAPVGTGTVKVAAGVSESNAVSFRVLGTIPPGSGNPNNLSVRSYQPGDGAYACLNMVVEVVLRGEVAPESVGFAPGTHLDAANVAGANFYVRRTSDGSVVAGVADAVTRGSQTTLRLYPDPPVPPNPGELVVRNNAPPPDYQIVLKGGVSGLRSTTGGILATDAVCDGFPTDADCVINFDTVNNAQDDQCRLSHFEIEPVAPVFTCAGRDNCEGDAEPSVAGHQRVFEAFPINRAGQSAVIASPLEWSSSNTSILSEAAAFSVPVTPSQQEFNVGPTDGSPAVNGSTIITVRADIAGADISGSTEARVFLCANPWPPEMAEDGLPFHDKSGDDSFTQAPIKTNFSTFYCRDRGEAGPTDDLPEIPKRCFDPSAVDLNREPCTTNAQCQTGETCKYIEFGYNDPGRSNEQLLAGEQLLKEIFLSAPELESTIIIQSLTNLQNSSASEWYSRQSYRGDPKPLSAPLDGFEAIQDQRTIYVGALNDTRGDLPSIHNNIYRIVVSDQAPPDLISIFSQLVSNWRFLVNIGDDEQKEALRRDSQRIKHAHTLARLLDGANPAPALTDGSFLSGLSLSTWPSWDDALKFDFGTSLPRDPDERIQCDAAEGVVDSGTCRTGTPSPGYVCNAGTNAYMYVYRNQGAGASFSVNLEYAPPANWNWLTGAAWNLAPGEACMDKGLQYRKP
ncbi:MAG: Ig-like domain-containing protein [Parcubacteria group bacterium]|nr:Ig-like domain-containing protein [Parcubacteria group bacterium]